MKKLFAALLGVLMLSLVLTGIALADPVTQDDITFEVNVTPSACCRRPQVQPKR